MYVLHTYDLYSSVGFTVVTADFKGFLYPGSSPPVCIIFFKSTNITHPAISVSFERQ